MFRSRWLNALIAALVAVSMMCPLAYAGAVRPEPSQYLILTATTNGGTPYSGVSFTGKANNYGDPNGARNGPHKVSISAYSSNTTPTTGTVRFYWFKKNGTWVPDPAGITAPTYGCRDFANNGDGSTTYGVTFRSWEGPTILTFSDGPDSSSITISTGTTPQVLFRW